MSRTRTTRRFLLRNHKSTIRKIAYTFSLSTFLFVGLTEEIDAEIIDNLEFYMDLEMFEEGIENFTNDETESSTEPKLKLRNKSFDLNTEEGV